MKPGHELYQYLEFKVGNKIVPRISKMYCYLNDVAYVEQYLDDNGIPIKELCKLYHDKKGEIVVVGSYSEISNVMFPDIVKPSVGFKSKENVDEDIRPKGRKSNRKRRGSGNTRV